MFHSVDKTEDLSPGGSLSASSGGLLRRGKGGTDKTRSLEHQKITDNQKKTRHLELMNLVLFCVWDSLGSLKSFL